MKLLVIFFGLLAATSAISPIGTEVRNRASVALTLAGLVNVPRIQMQVILTGPVLDVYADGQLDCVIFGGVMNSQAVETYVSITPVGLEEHFELELEAAFATDIGFPVDITVELLGIPLGLGDCMVTYSDMVWTLKAWGAYNIGNPSSAVIVNVDASIVTSDGSITNINGASVVVTVLGLLGADLITEFQEALQDKLLDVLAAGLL